MSVPQPCPELYAVITGASQGIGEALAHELARRGHNLVIVARRTPVLEELAAVLRERHGIKVDVRGVDLADQQARQTLCDELAKRPVSILCNNAGIASFGQLKDLDPVYERNQVQVNAVAIHDLTLAVIPSMAARRSGGILTVGSAAGNMPIPGNATYAATKAFANSFSESLRGELRGVGINVTLLAPGPVRGDAPPADEQSIVDKMVPDFLWIDTARTAKMAIDALEVNKMRVVPGLLSKAMSVAGGYSPRAVVAPIVGAFYKRLDG